MHEFKGNPSIKNTIQALGVPHSEVDLILVNSNSVDFDYRMQGGEEVSVYPVFESFDISPVNRLRPAPLRKTKFIVDVNLGKMVSKLRLLGFDTYYRNNLDDDEIIHRAKAEKRIILTRDKGILMQNEVTHGYYLRSDDPEKQIEEVIQRFQLCLNFKPFTRCANCNGILKEIEKNDLIDKVPYDTLRYYNDFWECENCRHVYWEGSHFKRITDWIKKLEA